MCDKCREDETGRPGEKRSSPAPGSGAYPSTELEALREYAKATEYWQIEPSDSKERRAHLQRIASLAAMLPNCELHGKDST